MKNKLLILFIVLAIKHSLAQDPFVSRIYVAPFRIDSLVASPIIPDGFRLANIEFIKMPNFASSAMILDNMGKPIWRYTTELNLINRNGSIFDFYRINDSVQTMHIFSADGGFFLVLDNDFNVLDTVRAANSSTTRPHEMITLPNGNFLVMGMNNVNVDSTLVGKVVNSVILTTNTKFESSSIQEQDRTSKDVIKQFNFFDHINPLDETDTLNIISSSLINIIHPNSIDFFIDGTDTMLLVSGRDANTIYLINWNTQQIVKRLGGRKNDFVFIPPLYSNDSLNLFGQHYAKIIEWKPTSRKLKIRVYNNRYNVAKSEALILTLDLNMNLVEKNASWASNPPLYTPQLGNIDEYNNRNYLINWGRTYQSNANASGYNLQGVKQFNAYLPDSCDSYRIIPVPSNEMTVLKSKQGTIVQQGCKLIASSIGNWSTGVKDIEIEVTSPGSYFIEQRLGIGWITSNTITIYDTARACGTTSIDEIINDGFTIYPNPSTGTLHLNDIGTYAIYSSDGKLVQIYEVKHSKNISIELSKGLYLVRKSGHLGTKRILIQ